MISAVFLDVDFTLIYPGPTFQAVGYAAFCERYGISVDPARFPDAVRAASSVLDDEQEHVYDARIFVRYVRRIIEEMGGSGGRVDDCAGEIYTEWAASQHFFLYDDVGPALRELADRGIKIGVISNSHRPLQSFLRHFELDDLITASVSSSDHGFMKPHPSIFKAALQLVDASPSASVMVGDSLMQDIEGARRVGMHGVLVHRSDDPAPSVDGVPVIRTLADLPSVVSAIG